VTTGGSEALLFAMMACFDPGDELIIPGALLRQLQRLRHYRRHQAWCPCKATIEDGFELPLGRCLRSAHHPAHQGHPGLQPRQPHRQGLFRRLNWSALRQVVIKHDLFLFADEVYREFCYDGTRHISAMELAGIGENTVLIDSVSKRYSMCGARVGALGDPQQGGLRHRLEIRPGPPEPAHPGPSGLGGRAENASRATSPR
jgi:aspartate aminotransferase